MTVFADSSALVKVYTDEEHSGAVWTLMASETLATSALAWVELASAFWRKERAAMLDPGDVGVLLDIVETDLFGDPTTGPSMSVVDVDHSVLGAAVVLAGRHGLRAGDSIQLASALAARSADPECVTVLCFDHRLRGAAAREGFRLLPAEL